MAFAERLTAATDGRSTDAYKYNLVDAEPGGHHCCTSLGEYRVIVGRVEATVDALAEIRTSFVPLAAGDPDLGWEPASVGADDVDARTWTDLCAFIDGIVRRGVRGPPQFMNKGAIAEFPSFELARALCRSIIARSGCSQGRPGCVAIPPLSSTTGAAPSVLTDGRSTTAFTSWPRSSGGRVGGAKLVGRRRDAETAVT